jgi:ribosome modulation factor
LQFRDYPLLNTPSLIALMLRLAAEGTPSVEDCARRLEALLAAAGERPAVPASKIRLRLKGLRRDLETARLIAPVGEDRFQLTDRGQAALAAHPSGFATDDLTTWPEYAAALRARALDGAAADPHEPAFDAGFDAGLKGRPAAENPYPPDSADHQAWENGWSEAGEPDPR